jgi:thiol-disulfide isomerase/thioredoxin
MIRCAGLLLALGTLAGAAPEGWTSDFEAAKKQAAAEKKDLLIDFTGSDWCGWCIKLKKEVFDQQAFKDGVKDKFVLVEIDFPQDESKLTPEIKAQNEKLQEKYGVQGFPTIILADESGRPYATTGYEKGGPKAYLPLLDEKRKIKTTRDEKLAAAAKLEGPAKAAALVASLDGVSEAMISDFYPEVVAAIKEADPQDTTGMVKRLNAPTLFAEFGAKVSEHFDKKELKEAEALVDKAIAEKTFEGPLGYEVFGMKIGLQVEQKKFDEAIKTVDEAAKAMPESPFAAQSDNIKGQIEKLKSEGASPEPEAAPEKQ